MSSPPSRSGGRPLWDRIRDPTRRPHIGVLLDNTAEYLFWLGAAAITPVGDRRHQRDVPRRRARAARRLHRLPAARDVGRVRGPPRRRAAAAVAGRPCAHDRRRRLRARCCRRRRSPMARPPAEPDDLYLLIFTSGSTGFPKAVRCTQGRFARTGHPREERRASSARARRSTRRSRSSTRARCSPGSSSALQAEVPFGSRGQVLGVAAPCPTSAAWARRCSRTRARSSTTSSRSPPSPDDADLAAEFAFGNEASEADIREFAARFDCRGARQLRLDRGPHHHPARRVDAAAARSAAPTTTSRCSTPTPGASARAPSSTRPGGCSTPTSRWARSSTPRPATRSRATTATRKRTSSKVRDGIYWSGDLAYRDADGWFFFAGRSNEWLRVDGENFAAAPVERDRAALPRASGRPRCTRCPTIRSATG